MRLPCFGYSSVLFFIAGYLAQIVASNIFTVVGNQRKWLSYIFVFIGIVLLLFSFKILFISLKQEIRWSAYFLIVVIGTEIITTNLSKFVFIEQKQLRSILKFMSYVLLLVALWVMFLQALNEDAFTISSFLSDQLIKFSVFQ